MDPDFDEHDFFDLPGGDARRPEWGWITPFDAWASDALPFSAYLHQVRVWLPAETDD